MTAALSHKKGVRWLEPSHGRGAFIEEISRKGATSEEIVGVDLSRRAARADRLCEAVRGTDFLAWSKLQRNGFDRIIGNPPFIAIERLRDPLRSEAATTSWDPFKNTGLNGNLWLAFLLASLRVLKPHGDLSFVLPAAWGYAEYAAKVRQGLPRYFREFVCHRSKMPLFPTVQDGCYVIQCFGFGEENRITSSHVYEKADDLIIGLRPPVRPTAPALHIRAASPTKEIRMAGEQFQVRLGAVTGDSNYFLLSEERRNELHLPSSCLVPVVTRARHLNAPSIRSNEWTDIRDSGDRAYLFRPQKSCLHNEALRSYLRLSFRKGGCNRTAGWVRKRDPWYLVDLPGQFDGFMSGTNTKGPWIALNAMEDLAATNTLYVVRFDGKLRTRDEKAACALSLLTTFSRAQFESRTRNYAAGMKKLEPSDITGVHLPVTANVDGAYKVYKAAAQMFIDGDSKEASEIADNWFAARWSE